MAKPIEFVKLGRAPRRLARRKQRGVAIVGPAENSLVIVAKRQQRPGEAQPGIEPKRVIERFARLSVPGTTHALLQRQRLHREVPCAEILRPRPERPLLFRSVDLGLDADDDALCNFFLHGEDVGDVAVEPLRPEMMAARGVDELRGDAHAVAAAARAPFDEVGDAKFPADLNRVLRSSLVDKGRVARDHGEPAPIRERRYDLLGEAVDEIVLGGIAAHIVEGQNRHRRTRGKGSAGRRRHRILDDQPKHAHGSRDVLQHLLAFVDETMRQSRAHFVHDGAGNADTARAGERLEARRDVDPIAQDVLSVDDDIAEMNAKAKRNTPIAGNIHSGLGDAALDLDSTGDRIDGAGEVEQQTIPHGLDDAPPIVAERLIDRRPADLLEARQSTHFIETNEPAKALYIRADDGSELSLHSTPWRLSCAAILLRQCLEEGNRRRNFGGAPTGRISTQAILRDGRRCRGSAKSKLPYNVRRANNPALLLAQREIVASDAAGFEEISDTVEER